MSEWAVMGGWGFTGRGSLWEPSGQEWKEWAFLCVVKGDSLEGSQQRSGVGRQTA